jgi:pilus biogenesis lipoprotein CpaD
MVPVRLALLVSVALLGACAGPRFPDRAAHPAGARHAVFEQRLSLPPEGAGLTAAETEALRALAADAARGMGEAALTAPVAGAARMAAAADLMVAAGLGARSLIDPAADALTVAVPRLAAPIRGCPDWMEARVAHPLDPVRPPAPRADALSLGCATDVALEAMLAQPTDLVAPRETAPASAAGVVRGVAAYRTTGPAALADRAAGQSSSQF